MREKVPLIIATSEGSGESAHRRSLARAFALRTYNLWKRIKIVTKNKSSSKAENARIRFVNDSTETKTCRYIRARLNNAQLNTN